jgi:hypothetical protein
MVRQRFFGQILLKVGLSFTDSNLALIILLPMAGKRMGVIIVPLYKLLPTCFEYYCLDM